MRRGWAGDFLVFYFMGCNSGGKSLLSVLDLCVLLGETRFADMGKSTTIEIASMPSIPLLTHHLTSVGVCNTLHRGTLSSSHGSALFLVLARETRGRIWLRS